MADADGAREIVVPLTVMTPPGVSVWPPMVKAVDEPAVKVEPPTVTTGAPVAAGAAGARVWVLPLITTLEADGASEMVVPLTVITPPGVSVCPPTVYCVAALGVIVEPPTVIGAGVFAGAAGISVCVFPLTTTFEAEGASDIVVPPAVITPPGVSVWPPMVNCDAEFAVIVCPPTVIGAGVLAGDAGEAGIRVCVLPLTTTLDAEGASDIVVPPAVMTPPGVKVCPPMVN